jgi:hypothetical protein
MNKWKIYFLFFGFALCFGLFGILNKNALAVESYKISPEQDRTLKRDFHDSLNISDSKNIDMHYYFYATNNYNENINVIAYVCEYKPNYYAEDVKTVPDCGLSMVQEAGKFKIKLKGSAYKLLSYSRRTQKVSEGYVQVDSIYGNQNSTKDVASFTDADFEKGLTLLGGSTLKVNNWNRNEGGFLVGPVGENNQNQNNNSQNNNNGGGFDILGGIKAFFQPMINSIDRTQKAVLGISDNIVNGIKNLFSGLIESVKNIWDFLSNFFTKLFEELGKFVKWIFIPESDVLTKQIKGFTDLIDLSFQPLKQTLGIDFVDPMYLNSSRCNGSPSGLTGNGDGRSSGMNLFMDGVEINICKVPKPLIFLARNLFRFSVIFVLLHRLSITLPIVLGSRYVWERSEKGDNK